MAEIARGMRNNNPLNIRIGNAWRGERTENTDGEFEQFICIHYGLRAGFILLRRYIEHYKLNTITQIVSRWAPATENNTKRYIKNVMAMTGFAEDKQLNFGDRTEMVNLVSAMIRVECGITLPDADIIAGYELALHS